MDETRKLELFLPFGEVTWEMVCELDPLHERSDYIYQLLVMGLNWGQVQVAYQRKLPLQVVQACLELMRHVVAKELHAELDNK